MSTDNFTIRSQIAKVVSDFLKECNIVVPRGGLRLDPSYRSACHADVVRRGIDLKLFSKYLDTGIALGDTTYRHLENDSLRVLIAIWTGIVALVDDYCEIYADGLKEFSARFTRRDPQLYPALDWLAEATREFSEYWDAVRVDMIIVSVLEFLAASRIEKSIEGMEIKTEMAPGFPQFMRGLSGIAKGYCFQTFPPDLDVKEWIQAIPDMMRFCEYINDLLSFYKEELDLESVNLVSLNAKTRGVSKIVALQQLADTTADCYRRGIELLQSCPKAQNTFKECCIGFVVFHWYCPRYKLNELESLLDQCME